VDNLNSSRLRINDPDGQTRVVVNAEIADTKEKKGSGLGNRDSLATDSGMLFVFDKPDKYKFWMKGMHFALDFIWILDDKVVDILPNVQPPTLGQDDASLTIYIPQTNINKLLEVNSGFASAHGIQVGDTISMEQVQ
jgi:uncharacterized membrane protein (UPF0127 family)